ncbi:MAG: glycosyltransferase [Desulfurococcaceae archaeon]
MKRKLLVISMPFRLGIGGFLRSYNVVPRLTRLLAESGYELELYIPVNAIRTFVSFLMSTKLNNMSKGCEDLLDELLALAIKDVCEVQRLSKYSFAINEKLLEKNVEYNRKIVLKESEWKFSLSSHILYREELRPFFIHFFEKGFAGMASHFIKNPSYAYSMHETADAITALTFLSSKKTKSAVLLQSDLGKKFIHRTFSLNLFKNLSKKTKLCGILSVSPAPIMETPELFTLCKNLKILVPGVAVERELFRNVPRNKRANVVIYYGRISKEKGIFDLLRAWNIIEKKVDAYLYLAGRFEDYKTRVKFDETIKKYNLKAVKYLGYLDRNKLFKIASTASVLAYPSYRDSFSLTVLESLFMGLRVVAYEIPALSFLYQQNPNVELIPVGNFKRLALAIISNLEKPFKKDETTTKLLDEYSSWEKVAIEEYRKLSEMLDTAVHRI